MLSLQDVNKVFRTESLETTALNGINLNIGRGEGVSVRELITAIGKVTEHYVALSRSYLEQGVGRVEAPR